MRGFVGGRTHRQENEPMTVRKPTAKRTTPVVVLRTQRSDNRPFIRLVPAALVSVTFHGILLALFLILSSPSQADSQVEPDEPAVNLTADLVPTEPPATFMTP